MIFVKQIVGYYQKNSKFPIQVPVFLKCSHSGRFLDTLDSMKDERVKLGPFNQYSLYLTATHHHDVPFQYYYFTILNVFDTMRNVVNGKYVYECSQKQGKLFNGHYIQGIFRSVKMKLSCENCNQREVGSNEGNEGIVGLERSKKSEPYCWEKVQCLIASSKIKFNVF